MLFIHETFLVYKLETFKNCKEVKQIMIMIIAIIYILYLMWYLINSWKLLSEKPLSLPWKKIHSPLKMQKVQVPPFLPTLKTFQSPPLAERGGREEGHEWPRWNHWSTSSQHLLHFEKSITQRLRRPPKKKVRCLRLCRHMWCVARFGTIHTILKTWKHLGRSFTFSKVAD